jgi:hypothetical protein
LVADYPLTQLGTAEFEHMAQALLAARWGPLTVKVYGQGRDGGRELTTRAEIDHEGESWSGYTVAQAKFRSRPLSVDDNARWLRNEIRKELDAWVDKDKNRQPKPDNLLFISNVPLSAVPGHGLDHVETVFADFAEQLPLKAFAVLHYDHVCRLLDANLGIRTSFAGLLTTGDVLAQLHRLLVGEAVDLGRTMRLHAAKELVAEQWVRLGSAGAKGNEKQQLAHVGSDLYAARRLTGNEHSWHSGAVPVIGHVLQLGNAVLRPSVREGRPPHLEVLTE